MRLLSSLLFYCPFFQQRLPEVVHVSELLGPAVFDSRCHDCVPIMYQMFALGIVACNPLPHVLVQGCRPLFSELPCCHVLKKTLPSVVSSSSLVSMKTSICSLRCIHFSSSLFFWVLVFSASSIGSLSSFVCVGVSFFFIKTLF